MARFDRSCHYDWLRDDAAYAAMFARAQQLAADSLESEAVSRAMEGVWEPNVYQGEFIYPWIEDVDIEGEVLGIKRADRPLGVWKKSDALLLALLKAAKPEKYRENFKAEISGPGGGPISLDQQKLKSLTDDELAALIAIASKLDASGGDASGAETPGSP